MASFDRARIEALLNLAGERLEGEWLLVRAWSPRWMRSWIPPMLRWRDAAKPFAPRARRPLRSTRGVE